MLGNSKAFSGFAVKDLDKAKEFYGQTLGLHVTENEMGLLDLQIPGTSQSILIYPKPDHVPATYTILNFLVDDIDKAVDQLAEAGVRLERYEGFEQDAKGVMRGTPQVAWFTDPDGNILSVIQS
jgi:catechol 2,3-dioxygenase-like lactoylglutathione lyase family enzyme